MALTVIGVTTDSSRITTMLGAKNETEYGLYQETAKGKYYASFLPDGSMGNRLVRLVTSEQASELETNALTAINKTAKKIQEIVNSAPVIDLERFRRNMESINLSSKEIAAQIGQDVRKTCRLCH